MLRKFVFRIVGAAGYRLVAKSYPGSVTQTLLTLASLSAKERSRSTLSEQERFLDLCIQYAKRSRSQIFQDVMVLHFLRKKTGGVFVEFGCCDGQKHSNTYLLEKEFGWRGVVVEPARIWHATLDVNRNCHVDHRCVWSENGKLIEFHETPNPEFSTAVQYCKSDRHGKLRTVADRYWVHSVALNSLLEDYGVSPGFEYLSVDTEGSELEILESFDFQRFKPAILSVEHNFRRCQERLETLVTRNGYVRVFRDVSAWDAWFVRADLAPKA